MFGSDILDVAIGLAFVFLLMSFLATAIREGIESVIKARAVHLERGIRMLLDDPAGTGISRAFYEHPLVNSLFHGTYDPKARRFLGGLMPTYIPARNFADTVIDLAIRGPVPSEYAIMQTDAQTTVAALRRDVGRLRSPQLIRAMMTAMDGAGDDIAIVRANLEQWFNSGMDRVSGQYKRRTHFWLFVIGLFLASVLNVNAITIVNHLARNKALRESIVARSSAIVHDSTYLRLMKDTAMQDADVARVRQQLDALDLPIGIERYEKPKNGADLVHLIGGLLVTAFAVTLGAPFWFDALNRMMVIRSTVKPSEKSRDEASKDPTPASAPARNAPAEVTAVAPAAAPVAITASPPAAAPPMAAPPSAAAGFQPHEWVSGDVDEGVL